MSDPSEERRERRAPSKGGTSPATIAMGLILVIVAAAVALGILVDKQPDANAAEETPAVEIDPFEGLEEEVR